MIPAAAIRSHHVQCAVGVLDSADARWRFKPEVAQCQCPWQSIHSHPHWWVCLCFAVYCLPSPMFTGNQKESKDYWPVSTIIQLIDCALVHVTWQLELPPFVTGWHVLLSYVEGSLSAIVFIPKYGENIAVKFCVNDWLLLASLVGSCLPTSLIFRQLPLHYVWRQVGNVLAICQQVTTWCIHLLPGYVWNVQFWWVMLNFWYEMEASRISTVAAGL